MTLQTFTTFSHICECSMSMDLTQYELHTANQRAIALSFKKCLCGLTIIKNLDIWNKVALYYKPQC